MKYDDASWHYGGDFPSNLPDDAGATHIGMFVAWCLLNGMAGEIHTDDFSDELNKLKNREVTPGEWFMNACDEKFTDEDLNEEGNSFAAYYYAQDDAPYLGDYEKSVGKGLETLYHVPDTWETFDVLANIIKERYESWKN